MAKFVIRSLVFSFVALFVGASGGAYAAGQSIVLKRQLQAGADMLYFQDGAQIDAATIRDNSSFCVLRLDPGARSAALAPGRRQSLSNPIGVAEFDIGNLSFSGVSFSSSGSHSAIQELVCFGNNRDPLGNLVVDAGFVSRQFGDFLEFKAAGAFTVEHVILAVSRPDPVSAALPAATPCADSAPARAVPAPAAVRRTAVAPRGLAPVHYDFEGETVHGDRVGPVGVLVEAAPRIHSGSLIRTRSDFNDSMGRSVEGL